MLFLPLISVFDVVGPATPTLVFSDKKVQALLGQAYSHALDNLLRINVLPVGPAEMRTGLVAAGGHFERAGGDYQEPWTRDASVNSWSALSLVAPSLARDTMWAVCEKSAGGRIEVQNDNQWWDKIIWVMAAWNHYATTGDRAFLSAAYETASDLANGLISSRFDKEYGLFQGPSHLQDGIAGYPPPFDDPPGSSSFVLDHKGSERLMTLSVNCLYYGAFRALAQMATALHKDPSVARKWTELGKALRASINSHLWMPKAGSYAYLLFGEGELRGKQAEYQEATGISLAILCGVADARRARLVVERARSTRYGIPLVDPEFARYSANGPGRHSRIVWPLAQGYWAHAAAVAGNVERFRAEVETLANLVKGTDWNFYEIYNPETGKPDGGMQCGSRWGSCTNQAWSASAFVRMVHYGLFGMAFGGGGWAWAPLLPSGWDSVELRGLRYRGAVLDLALSGSGRRVVSVQLDGRVVSRAFVPAGLKGSHRLEVVVGG